MYKAQICEIINSLYKADISNELNYEESLESFGIDSIKYITILINIEEKYRITFDDNLLCLNSLKTIKNINEQLELLLNRG